MLLNVIFATVYNGMGVGFMAIYTCPRCNSRFYLDSKDIKSEAFLREFRCSSCGATYNDTPVSDVRSEASAHDAETVFVQTPTTHSSSTVGSAIKMLSIVVLVLCVMGSFVVMGETLVVGLAMLIVSVLFCLLSYGVGEIICLLKDIKNKMQ